MPVIFVRVQLFGALGWTWSTASLERVSYLAFSLALYMATIGPLAHMQAERRAFWIMRTVPVSVGRLLAAKARAWSIVVGAVALLSFSFLSAGAPVASVGAWLDGAAVVVGGAVGMTWLAIALAAGAADLSDDQRPAIGPATIYAFLFVGGLYNVLIGADLVTRARGYVLYGFALVAHWLEGVERGHRLPRRRGRAGAPPDPAGRRDVRDRLRAGAARRGEGRPPWPAPTAASTPSSASWSRASASPSS